MKNTQKGFIVPLVIVIILVAVGIVVYIAFFHIDWEQQDNIAQKDFQCKNSEYETVRNSYRDNLITLTSGSEEKLFKEIKGRGDVVLRDLVTLNCLEYLYLGSYNITDLSALSSLTNLKELIFMGSKVKNILPLANLKNLEKLKITSLNKFNDISPLLNLSSLKELSLAVTEVQCNQLKESLPNTLINCLTPAN